MHRACSTCQPLRYVPGLGAPPAAAGIVDFPIRLQQPGKIRFKLLFKSSNPPIRVECQQVYEDRDG